MKYIRTVEIEMPSLQYFQEGLEWGDVTKENLISMFSEWSIDDLISDFSLNGWLTVNVKETIED